MIAQPDVYSDYHENHVTAGVLAAIQATANVYDAFISTC